VIGLNIFLQKLFYPKELLDNGLLKVEYVKSNDNIADIFTKSLPAYKHWTILPKLGLHSMRDLELER